MILSENQQKCSILCEIILYTILEFSILTFCVKMIIKEREFYKMMRLKKVRIYADISQK